MKGVTDHNRLILFSYELGVRFENVSIKMLLRLLKQEVVLSQILTDYDELRQNRMLHFSLVFNVGRRLDEICKTNQPLHTNSIVSGFGTEK